MTQRNMDSTTVDQIIYIGQLMYERFLTDAAGGNVSTKVGDHIYLTPRYAGARYHWRLRRDLVNVLDLERNVLHGPSPISRESDMHLALYEAFPQIGSVIHAHAPNLMVFS
ncbi:MAG: class II aldolase/adducin family protein, partial [Anaerolineae bacterium]|nr:class II aldolase/adducin family protein [Anaerolineae bacterium]